MLYTIIQKELLAAFRSRQLMVLAVIYLVLTGAAFAVTYSANHQQQKQRQHDQHQAYTTWLGQGAENLHVAAHFGTYAYKPATALSFIDAGLNNYTGTQVRLEAHKQNEVLFSALEDANAGSRFGDLHLALVLQLFVPLFIIFLCFASISKEREDSTLKLLMAQGSSKSTVVWGKIAGNYLVVLAMVLPVLLVSFFFFSEANQKVRLLLLFSSYLLYYFLVTAGSVLVSGLSKNSKTALLTLLSVWVLASVLLPKATANLGDDLFPLISKTDFNTQIETDYKKGIDGHNPDSVRLKEMEKEVLAQYNVDSLSQLPVNFDALLMQADEEYNNTVYDKRFGAVQSTIRKQNRVGQWAGFINPFIAVRNLSMGFAGTDYEHFVAFHISTETYLRQMMKMLNGYMAANSKTGESKDAPASLWQQMPPYKYAMPPVAWVAQQHCLEIISLLLWTIVLALFIQPLGKRIAII